MTNTDANSKDQVWLAMVIEVQEPNDEQTSEVGWLLRSLGGESRCGSNGHMSPGVFTRLASFFRKRWCFDAQQFTQKFGPVGSTIGPWFSQDLIFGLVRAAWKFGVSSFQQFFRCNFPYKIAIFTCKLSIKCSPCSNAYFQRVHLHRFALSIVIYSP